MSHFYATIKGNKGEASRCGSKDSGIVSYTASWEGAVRTTLYYNEQAKRDYAVVSLVPWQGEGTVKVLYDGPVSGE